MYEKVYRICLVCWYSDDEELQRFLDLLKRFLNTDMSLVEVTSDQL